METFFYKEEDKLTPFTLDEKPIGKGGQAIVYRVILPVNLGDYCVKIYHKPCTEKLIYRLMYMIAYPPSTIKNTSFCICWPKGLVYNSEGVAVGFFMPMAFANSRDLSILSYYAKGKTIRDRFTKDFQWFDKYERTSGEGIMNRIKMMANISLAFHQIHSTGNYVAIDIKPLNILATSSGKISIVDTDSFQIAENDVILFPGTAATPDYCAPEFTDQHQQGRAFTISNDLFSLSVLYYQLLVGLHPFAGTILLPPYDTEEYNELHAVIQRSLFLYGCNKRHLKALSPNPHAFFERMPKELQMLFIRSFDAPNYRPVMEEWYKELYKVITK